MLTGTPPLATTTTGIPLPLAAIVQGGALSVCVTGTPRSVITRTGTATQTSIAVMQTGALAALAVASDKSVRPRTLSPDRVKQCTVHPVVLTAETLIYVSVLGAGIICALIFGLDAKAGENVTAYVPAAPVSP
jgi:hypothetical protein